MEVLAFRHDSDGADIVLGEEQLKAVLRCLTGFVSRFHYHFVFAQVCQLPEEYNRHFHFESDLSGASPVSDRCDSTISR